MTFGSLGTNGTSNALKTQLVAYFGWMALTSMYVIYRMSGHPIGFEMLGHYINLMVHWL